LNGGPYRSENEIIEEEGEEKRSGKVKRKVVKVVASEASPIDYKK
jgi:hypothetical protein